MTKSIAIIQVENRDGLTIVSDPINKHDLVAMLVTLRIEHKVGIAIRLFPGCPNKLLMFITIPTVSADDLSKLLTDHGFIHQSSAEFFGNKPTSSSS